MVMRILTIELFYKIDYVPAYFKSLGNPGVQINPMLYFCWTKLSIKIYCLLWLNLLK